MARDVGRGNADAIAGLHHLVETSTRKSVQAGSLFTLANMLESGVEFVAVDMPEADRSFLQIAAVFAEWEGRKISQRTKEALAAAKARGKKLGSPCPEKGGALGRAVQKEKAELFAGNVLPILRELQDNGVDTYYGLAKALRMRGIPTARGGRWEATTVRNLLTR